MKRNILILVVICLTVNCQAFLWFNKKKESSAAETFKGAVQQNSAIDSTVKGQQPPPTTATANGTNNTVTVVNMPSDVASQIVHGIVQNKTKLSDEETETNKSVVRMPIGVAILFGCFGLSLLIVCWILFSKLTATGKAADAAAASFLNLADKGFATISTVIAAKQSTSTDDKTNALLASLQAVVEKERGKINS